MRGWSSRLVYVLVIHCSCFFIAFGQHVTLATWNIRNLSKQSRSAEELGIIGVIISRYDCIAIQEVLDPESIQSIHSTILDNYHLNFSYVVSDPVGTSKKERYAFMWRDDKIKTTDTPWLFDDPQSYFERRPFCQPLGTLTGTLEFTLCTVHIIYGSKVEDRRAEIRHLKDVYLDAKERKPNSPPVILGDFNMPPTDSSWEELESQGLLHAINPPSKTTIGGVSLYDNIWWPKQMTEVIAASAQVFEYDNCMFPPNSLAAANLVVSDHRPVFVTIDPNGVWTPFPSCDAQPAGTTLGTWKVTNSSPKSRAIIGLLSLVAFHHDLVFIQGLQDSEVADIAEILTTRFKQPYNYQLSSTLGQPGESFLYKLTTISLVGDTSLFVNGNHFTNPPFCGPFNSAEFAFYTCGLSIPSEDVQQVSFIADMYSSLKEDISSPVVIAGHFGVDPTNALWNNLKKLPYNVLPATVQSYSNIDNKILDDNLWMPKSPEVIANSGSVLPFDEWFYVPDFKTLATELVSTHRPVKVSVNTGFNHTSNVADCRLLFSEYVEGSSFNKAIEIFNPTSVTVDLSFYELWKITNVKNDSSWETRTDITLSGHIQPRKTFTIAHPSANSEILGVADLTSGNMNFDGNDAIGLACDGVLVDVIGSTDVLPSTGWPVAGISDATKDHTLVRKSFVTSGQTDWLVAAGTNNFDSEWTVKMQNDINGLGSHDFTIVNGSKPNYRLFFSEYIEGSSFNKALEIFNPGPELADLSHVQILKIQSAAQTTGGTFDQDATSIQLSGILEPGGVFIICHPSAADEILQVAGMVSNKIIFDGNDALGLYYDDEFLDQIGDEGVAPIGGWNVSGVFQATKDHTLLRKSHVNKGNKGQWAQSSQLEWVVEPQDTFWSLGSHDHLPPTSLTSSTDASTDTSTDANTDARTDTSTDTSMSSTHYQDTTTNQDEPSQTFNSQENSSEEVLVGSCATRTFMHTTFVCSFICTVFYGQL